MPGAQVLDYRGYGGSEGSPTEAGFYQDGAAAVAWVKERQQAAAAAAGAQGPPRRRLVLWGERAGQEFPQQDWSAAPAGQAAACSFAGPCAI